MLAEPPVKSQSRTWDPYSIVPIYRPHLAVNVVTDFRFEARAEGTTSPWEVQKQRATRQFGRRHTRGHAQSGRQRPQRLCGIFTRFTRWTKSRARNNAPGNGRNDYAEFSQAEFSHDRAEISHGEHPKSQLEKSA